MMARSSPVNWEWGSSMVSILANILFMPNLLNKVSGFFLLSGPRWKKFAGFRD